RRCRRSRRDGRGHARPGDRAGTVVGGRPMTGQPPVALTIAGSDSGGGAGVQADLKAFAMHGVFGSSVITALTAQNTAEVRAIEPVPPGFVAAQLEAVLDDLPVRAAKTGMLASAE